MLAVLRVTLEAATLVQRLTQVKGLRPEAGLRITTDPVHQSLRMLMVPVPDPLDTVLTEHGAFLFIATAAEPALRRGTLRAELAPSRTAFFLDRAPVVRPLPGPRAVFRLVPWLTS